MNKHISDEDVDRTLRQLFNEAAVDDSLIDDIVASPAVWRRVRENISEANAPRSPWPPVVNWLRWFAVAVPVAAALALAAGVIWHRTSDTMPPMAAVETPTVEPPASVPAPRTEPPIETRTDRNTVAAVTRVAESRKAYKSQIPAPVNKPSKALTAKVPSPPAAAAPLKSDFIALSLARDAESGQIVRVKVPSSMMVSLGLVESVNKPTDLVDAEVIVGDDGLTRAIRFIR
jgi:hypothetical protein